MAATASKSGGASPANAKLAGQRGSGSIKLCGRDFFRLREKNSVEVRMPKRVIDFDAVWASDKLANCAPWARAEYTWIYGLADGNGSFELTNPRVIFGRVYAIRDDVSIQHLSRALEEFQGKGLL